MQNQKKIEIRGHRVYSRPARIPYRLLSAAADIGLGLLLFSLYAGSSRMAVLHPLPHARWISLVILAWLVPWIVLRVLFGRSLGEAFWRLRARPGARHPFAYNTLQETTQFKLASPSLASAILLTLALLGSGLAALAHQLSASPLFATASERSLLPSLPISQGDAGLAASSWRVLPFYYLLGSWPISYDGNPALFTIPYEKGPPALFIGRIQSKWGDSGKIRLTLEGPKTPKGSATRDALHACLTGPHPFRCAALRSRSLSRQLEAMQALKPEHWEISWFRVENAALGIESETQGVFIRAESETAGQDRYLLINSGGMHQAVFLDYPLDDEGRRARGVLESAIRSVRSSAQLSEGRAWIDKELSAVQLDPNKRSQDVQDARKLAELQALLVAKLSVDPSVTEAYFHLAGTSILLLRRAATPLVGSVDAAWLRQSSFIVKNQLGSLRLYARDLAAALLPTDETQKSHLREIDAFALEAAKY